MNGYIQNTINLAGIVTESIVDGPGLRYTLFAQGCPHHCYGCHNPHTHSFDGGKPYMICEIAKSIKNNPLLDGVTYSGGEPFCQTEAFIELSERLINEKIPNFNIYCFTGYTFEELVALNDENVNKLISLTDVLKDGRYEEKKRSLELKFKGSSNQRFLDAKESLKRGKAVLFE